MDLGLGGRRCIVTGASQGIGAEIARALADEGAHVALVARNGDKLGSLAAELRGRNAVALPLVADLSRPGEAERVVAAAAEQFGGLDVLVNNAGTSPMGALDAVSDEDWQHSFDLKLLGYVRCIRAVLPHLRAQRRGRIVNMAGAAGRQANPLYVLGCLNAAILHLTKSLAEELAADGVSVVAINPGATATERMRGAIRTWAAARGEDPDAFERGYPASALPLGRMAAPEEIGRLTALLCSDLTEQLTGSALQADGAATRGVF